MTLTRVPDTGSHAHCQDDDLTDQTLTSRVTARSPEAIARAEALLARSSKATGEDRFAAAVACALLCRASGRPELDAGRDLEHLNPDICAPPLDLSEIGDAVYVAFCEPELADRIVADALSAGTDDAPVSARAELAARHAPAGQPEAIVGDGTDLPADHETLPTELGAGTQARSGADAHEVLVVEIDQRGGGKETLLKLQADGQDCPTVKTLTARNPDSRVLRFIYALPPGTWVTEGTIGRGIKVFGCSETAALEGFEVIVDLPQAPPNKCVLAQFTARIPSEAPVDENVSVITKTTGKVERRSDDLVITKITRKVGRPAGRTKDRPFQMRVDDAFITKIDDWRRQQSDFPTRTGAVRRLVEQALNGKRG